ncbi:MAG: mechanosensitive ion channel domain-containing protein [Paracoccaceae bacterium]
MPIAVPRRLAALALILALWAASWAAPGPEALAQSASQALPGLAGAEPAAAPAEPDSPEAARALVSTLTDAEVRALLLERLDAVARERAQAAGHGGLGATLSTAADSLAASVAGALERAPNVPTGIAEGLGRFYAPRGALGTLHLLAIGALAVGLGFLAERAVCRYAPALRAPEPGAGPGPVVRFLARRLMVEVAGVAAFLAVARLVIALAHPPEPISDLILTFFLFIPVLYTRAAAALGRFLLAPSTPAARMVRLDDAEARFLHRAIVAFAALVGLRAYALSFLGGHGVDLAAIRLGFWLTLAIHGWLAWVAWSARASLVTMLAGGAAPGSAEARAARTYPYAVIALVALFWAITEVFTGQGFWDLLDGRLPLTLAILVLAPVADLGLRGLAAHLAPRPEPARGEKAVRLAERLRVGWLRIGRLAVLGLLLVVLLDLWRVDLAMAAGGPMPVRFAAGLVTALAILGLGALAAEAAALWVNKRLLDDLPEEAPGEVDAGGEGGAAGGSRLSTVLPLTLGAAQAAIALVAGFEALSALGVSIAPLLAGLGILGLAVGFGAQRLVADVVSGVFFLVDDAFRTGEYVEIEGTRGTVERISVRSLQLRHHEGAVHTIPFGEIPRLTNYSRDWVIMKLRFTVPFDTDLKKVKRLFKGIGQDMAADPAFADDFLQPFKSQGVVEVDDVGLVVRGKFMAKPGRQWTLRKEIFARVQQAFEANDIQFARREVRVRLDGEGAVSPEAARQAAAAAAEAVLAPRSADAAP